MKKLLFLLLLLLPWAALGEGQDALTLTAPESVRPWSSAVLSVTLPQDGTLTLTLQDAYSSWEIVRREAAAGTLELPWDGLAANGEAPARGSYTLAAALAADGQVYSCELPLRILSPAAALQYCIPSSDVVYAGSEGFLVNYLLLGDELIHVRLSAQDAPDTPLKTWALEPSDALPHIFTWDGRLDGRSVPEGSYWLTFSVKNSLQEPFRFPLEVRWAAPPVPAVDLSDTALFLPGAEADDAAIWKCLMAPLTVVDIGRMQHQSIYAAPSAKSAVLGTLHGQSHGVRVLALQADGYARIGTWRQEDGSYVEGYVPQNKLKNVLPNAHYGLLVDKSAQTLTVYQDGQRLGTVSVSTGLMAKDKLFRETPAGAFLTTDRIASFKDEGYQYNCAIRIDGGNLIHSAGCKLRGGKMDYSEQAPLLGQKASHGCIRVNPVPEENGLNMYWLWTHLPYNTKVLVLDDPDDRAARMAQLMPTSSPSAAPTPTRQITPAITPANTFFPSPTPAVTPAPTATPLPTFTPAPAYERVLAYKSKGLPVLQLQERLHALGYYSAEIDGLFGNATQDAVVAFQKVNGLSADGMVGQKTFAALWDSGVLPAPSPTPTAAPTAAPSPTPSPVPPTASPSPTPSPTPVPPPPEEATLTITLAGDALLGSEDAVRRRENSFDSIVAARRYAYPLRHFAPIFAADDVTYLNLECVLKDNAQDKTEGRLYNFRGPTAFTQILTEASVEHVNIANNHYIDYGYSGRRSTRAALEAAGITYSGYTRTWIYEKDGIKIGFAGIRETVWKQDRAQPAREIAALREAGCHYIFYACHFGTEYETAHNSLQAEMAHAILDAGADCIVGTHPHVVQGIEIYDGKPVFYSLGNFVFGGNLAPTDYDGLAVQAQLHFTRQQCDGQSFRLIPLLTSGMQDGTTDFCPVPAEGEDKARILQRIQEDSTLTIEETLYLP